MHVNVWPSSGGVCSQWAESCCGSSRLWSYYGWSYRVFVAELQKAGKFQIIKQI